MNSNTYYHFYYDSSFDCRYYLNHRIELPDNDEVRHMGSNNMEVINFADRYFNVVDKHDYNFSAAKLKKLWLGESFKGSSIEDHLPITYSDLVFAMNQSELEDLTRIGKELKAIREISAVNDMPLSNSMMPYYINQAAAAEDWIHTTEASYLEGILRKEMQEMELLKDVGRYKKAVMQNFCRQCPHQYHNLAGNNLKEIRPNEAEL